MFIFAHVPSLLPTYLFPNLLILSHKCQLHLPSLRLPPGYRNLGGSQSMPYDVVQINCYDLQRDERHYYHGSHCLDEQGTNEDFYSLRGVGDVEGGSSPVSTRLEMVCLPLVTNYTFHAYNAITEHKKIRLERSVLELLWFQRERIGVFASIQFLWKFSMKWHGLVSLRGLLKRRMNAKFRVSSCRK
ncbi:hypothetical protein VNO77_14958 [Canavalia gladiata]|uniref:Uncharacterized protein n=1 Tax=Canavalia gladiata TaxID=3824 RepID=A0AAN9M3W1_CANGL